MDGIYDNIIISQTPEQHQQHLQKYLNDWSISLKYDPINILFAQDCVEYLGFVVDGKIY